MFIPGETIIHAFIIPFATKTLTNNHATIYITYQQKDHILFERKITSGWSETDNTESKIEITLSQEEALLFKDMNDYFIQINVYLNGIRMTSEPIKSTNGVQFKREVI